MEEFARSAIADFQACSYLPEFDSDSICYLIKVVSRRLDATYELREALPRNVPSLCMEGSSRSFSAESVLRIILVPLDRDGQTPVISKHSLLATLLSPESKNFDPCALWFIAHRYDGFHRFYHNGLNTTIIGTSMYLLVWTFNPAENSTVALFMERRTIGMVEEFSNTLELYKRLAQSPGYIPYAMALAHCNWADSNTNDRLLSRIHELEDFAGSKTDGNITPWKRYDIDKISAWLKTIADVLINFANRERNTHMIQAILDSIPDMSEDCLHLDQRFHEDLKKSNEELMPVVKLLKGRASAYENYIKYLKERAERLSNIVSGAQK